WDRGYTSTFQVLETAATTSRACHVHQTHCPQAHALTKLVRGLNKAGTSRNKAGTSRNKVGTSRNKVGTCLNIKRCHLWQSYQAGLFARYCNMIDSPEVLVRTAPLYERLRRVIPEVEWPVFRCRCGCDFTPETRAQCRRARSQLPDA